jgi:hypothetical protein
MSLNKKMAEAAAALADQRRAEADAAAVSRHQQYLAFKTPGSPTYNPLAAAAMLNAAPVREEVYRGRDLTAALKKQESDAQQTATVAQLVASELAKKPTNTPPAATPAA